MEAMAPELRMIALTMYALMGLCTSLFVFLFITWWGTRGWLKPLVKAKLKGRALLLNLTKDKRLKLEEVENIAGMYKGKFGEYMINPESVYHNPAGVPTSIGYEHAGATLNPKHIVFLQKIMEEGVPMVDGSGKEFKQKIENIDELEDFAKWHKTNYGEDLILKYDGETLRVQDILNFFKYNVNPSLMEAKIENKLAKERMDEKKLPLKIFLVIIPFMFTLVICFMILMNFLNSQGSVQQLTECSNKLAVSQGELTACKAQQRVVSTSQGNSGGAPGGETSLT